MADPADGSTGSLTRAAAQVRTLPELAAVLRVLRRRHARRRRDRELTYRDLAERTGWSLTSIAEYFTARRLPPTDRFDALLVLLGADPAEQGVLASARDRVDEGRRGEDAEPGAAGPGAAVPRQLPPVTRHFTGRRRELAELSRIAGAEPVAGTVVITALAGTAGVGKTTLALHWAHQVADRFPDGHLYVNLRGFDAGGRATDPVTAIRGFLDALGVPPGRIPADPDAQAALYRTLLAGRRMLILLDNARDARQVRPLLPAAPRCLVVVTSRDVLAGLVAAEGAHPVPLDLFTPHEAREALARRLGAGRVAAEPAAVDSIVERCARLPLALAVVAARAGLHPDRPLARVARELAGARDRLDALADRDPDTDVRAVLSWSTRALTPPAARMFRVLGLHPGPDVTVPAAASVAAVPLAEAGAALAELAAASLVTERRPGRFACHDLLRAHAAALALAHDGEPERRAVTARVVDHYLHTALAADRLLDPAGDRAAPGAVSDGVVPERFADHRQALDWFTAEHAVLLAVVDAVATTGEPPVGPLVDAVAGFLDRQGHWHDALTIWGAAAGCAERRSDVAAQARARRHLGRACTRLYRFDDAGGHLRAALDLAGRAGDRAEQAQVHHVLAILCERRGDLDEALHHDHRALDLYRAVGDRLGEARALNSTGWHLTLRGDHDRALDRCHRALAVFEQLGDRGGQAHTLDSLGHAHHGLGRHDRAVTCYGRALALYRDLGDRFGEAEALDGIGDTRRDAGDADGARRSWRQALDILTALDHPSSARLRAKLGDPAAAPPD